MALHDGCAISTSTPSASARSSAESCAKPLLFCLAVDAVFFLATISGLMRCNPALLCPLPAASQPVYSSTLDEQGHNINASLLASEEGVS